MRAPISLGFVEPGHFHAALCLREKNPRVSNEIHLYAGPSPERDAFVALVESFNARTSAPTAWQIRKHENTDSLRAAVDHGVVDAVVLAGRNATKLEHAAALHGAGIAVLADKPWLTSRDALPALMQVTATPPLVMDIMTERFDIVARLRAALTASDTVFGEFVCDPDQAAIQIASVHHLCKQVNGAPLMRPPWYYDVAVQGDGLVDIQSHMVDQAQWLVGDPPIWQLGRDVSAVRAKRWPSAVERSLFQTSTGLSEFPESIAEAVHDDVLQLQCNSEIRYCLRDITVCQRAEWRAVEPANGGDLHAARLSGRDADIVLEQSGDTNYVCELHVCAPDVAALGERLGRQLKAWHERFPGLAMEPSRHGYRVIVPPRLRTTHESHFPMVLDQFIDLLVADTWPEVLAARIRMRYELLALALGVVDP